MLFDAWQGLLISEESVPLLSSAYRELLLKVMRLFTAKLFGGSHAPSMSGVTETSRRKLDSKQRVQVIAFCVYSLLRITPTTIA